MPVFFPVLDGRGAFPRRPDVADEQDREGECYEGIDDKKEEEEGDLIHRWAHVLSIPPSFISTGIIP